MTRRASLSALAAALLWTASGTVPAAAQEDDGPDSISIPVVQALPGGDSERLNEALGRLGRNPRDFVALVDAGYAALGMGDSEAAIGFFQRADMLGPGNARVRAGIACAHVRKEDPFTAIPLFAEAEKIAPLEARAQMDRALAYDMVGDNGTAQQLYRAVLAQGPNDEASRRLALSLAIAGDKPGMETALSPLLLKQDKTAWRTRAFSLAILGKAEEAEAIARSALSADQAVAMGAYLRYMPRLTPAQQAAAGNLGFFPRAADIGRDDPRVALYARPRTALAGADRQLVPAGQPLGRPAASSRIRDREDGRGGSRRRPPAAAPAPVPAAVRAPPAVSPSREVIAPAVTVRPAADPIPKPNPVAVAAIVPPPVAAPPSPARVFAQPAASVPVPVPVPAPVLTPPALAAAAPAPPPVATVAVATPVPTATPTPTPAPAAAPGFASLESGPARSGTPFDLARTSGAAPVVAAAPATPPPAAQPQPLPPLRPATPPPAQPKGTLADLFADLATPSREAVPQDGAVDIRTIAPTRAAATPAPRSGTPAVTRGGTLVAKPGAVPPKPAAPSHPSRIWVQLATGRDKAALGFDWRKLLRDDPEVFKGRKPQVSAFGQSNRLLTGPFESQAQANAFLAQLRKAGVSGAYIWTSPAGQVVDALTVK
jgi:tetratricopeptide (TPR) repeat protein